MQLPWISSRLQSQLHRQWTPTIRNLSSSSIPKSTTTIPRVTSSSLPQDEASALRLMEKVKTNFRALTRLTAGSAFVIGSMILFLGYNMQVIANELVLLKNELDHTQQALEITRKRLQTLEGSLKKGNDTEGNNNGGKKGWFS
ncbi:hypothetical protein HDU76_002925 [Blyttiomyces sp. JEL0837]|nr:hypothetical protein HDU76_002925 [Blyttiomyces sp. JEL0837]